MVQDHVVGAELLLRPQICVKVFALQPMIRGSQRLRGASDECLNRSLPKPLLGSIGGGFCGMPLGASLAKP